MQIDDFVMLGKTVPEPSKDGRIFVCSAGYSQTLRSLIRIYPLAKYAAPKTWSISTVRLERNPRDSRQESFQLAADRRPGVHNDINRKAFETHDMVPRSQRAELLRRAAFASIEAAEERVPGYGRNKTSLAILHARDYELTFDHNPESPDSPVLALFDRPDGIVPTGARRFPYTPRLRFRDGCVRCVAGGDGHHLMLREWGTYERIRKENNLTQMSEAQRRSYISDALHLDPTCSLLVGNLNNQPNAWLVISVLHGLRPAPSLLDELVGAA